MSNDTSSLLHLLEQQLHAAKAEDTATRAHNASGQVLQIHAAGRKLSTAYEQLRNAAEYIEEHLLLQRAIRRFYKRNFYRLGRHSARAVGEELILELTGAGYLQTGNYTSATADSIQRLTEKYTQTFNALRDADVPRDEAQDWVLSLLAVEVEGILNPHAYLTAFAYCAYRHYLGIFPRDSLTVSPDEHQAFEISLYIATHQSLLKSDIAIVRHDLMRMYHQTPDDLQEFIAFNRNVSQLFTLPLTQRLKRAITKHGAPLRVLKSMVENQADMVGLLHDRGRFLEAYDRQVMAEYKHLHRRVNKGLIKSIIFIFVTKVVIGVSIEVPYDLLVVGSVVWLPLGINLLFPPLYMASLKLGLKAPSQANAQRLHTYIDQALFQGGQLAPSLHDTTRTAPGLAQALYAILFFIPFAITVYILMLLHFNMVQAVIFFVFLSTASFLGFRLSTMVRELEVLSSTNTLSAIRDFFYLPFILVGQWLSSKYARINAVAFVLDIAIELPLKTVLRLIRQWARFINEKHDQLLG